MTDGNTNKHYQLKPNATTIQLRKESNFTVLSEIKKYQWNIQDKGKLTLTEKTLENNKDKTKTTQTQH